jgi:hypothetical protein
MARVVDAMRVHVQSADPATEQLLRRLAELAAHDPTEA